MVEHAQWSLTDEKDSRARAAACRFHQTPIDGITDFNPRDAEILIDDS